MKYLIVVLFIGPWACSQNQGADSAKNTAEKASTNNSQELTLEQELTSLTSTLEKTEDATKYKELADKIGSFIKKNEKAFTELSKRKPKYFQSFRSKMKKSKQRMGSKNAQKGAQGSKAASNNNSSKSNFDIGDIIDGIIDVVTVIIDNITVPIGSEKCGRVDVPVKGSPSADQCKEILKKAKCAKRECPGKDEVFCSCAGKGKKCREDPTMPVCSLGTSLCGMPTGMCLPGGKDPVDVLKHVLDKAAKTDLPPAGPGGGDGGNGGDDDKDGSDDDKDGSDDDKDGSDDDKDGSSGSIPGAPAN